MDLDFGHGFIPRVVISAAGVVVYDLEVRGGEPRRSIVDEMRRILDRAKG